MLTSGLQSLHVQGHFWPDGKEKAWGGISAPQGWVCLGPLPSPTPHQESTARGWPFLFLPQEKWLDSRKLVFGKLADRGGPQE